MSGLPLPSARLFPYAGIALLAAASRVVTAGAFALNHHLTAR